MDLFPWDFKNYFDKFRCPSQQITDQNVVCMNYKPAQITIIHDEKNSKVCFVRGHDTHTSVKLYYNDNYIQSFTDCRIVIEFINQFIHFNDDDTIIWNREGEKGISTKFTRDGLAKLLQFLFSEHVI